MAAGVGPTFTTIKRLPGAREGDHTYTAKVRVQVHPNWGRQGRRRDLPIRSRIAQDVLGASADDRSQSGRHETGAH